MAQTGRGRQKTRKVAVALPDMETASEHWLRNIRVSGLAFTVLALIVLGLVILAPSLRTLVNQQQQIAALNSSLADKEAQVKELKSNVARWSDPAYIEAQARERIYYVYPGEYPYIVIGNKADAPAAATEDGTPISDKIQTTQVDWMQSVLASVFTAGLTKATPSQLTVPVQSDQK